MQKLYEILLPLTTNAGQPAGLARNAFMNDCQALAKGYSVLPMISGAWENEEGEIIFDRSIPVRVVAEEKVWAKLVRLAHKHFSDQECLLSFCVSDAPEFTFPERVTVCGEQNSAAQVMWERGELKSPKGWEYAETSTEEPTRIANTDVDLSQFNYGRALGAPTGIISRNQYEHIADFAHCLSSVANQLSIAAWKLDMALQDTRTAQTGQDQANHLSRALDVYHATDVALETLEGKSGNMRVKFHRYGRAFRSAKGV